MRLILSAILAGTAALAMPAKSPAPIRPPVPSAPETDFKSLFPKQAWTDHALKEVMNSKLLKVTPKDAKSFCPGGMTGRNWVHLLASMAKYESNFNPNLEFKESGDLSGVISTGLLQISKDSGNAYGCGFRSQSDLRDPLKNLACGVKILEKWVVADGVVASGSGRASRGGARYWSVLRTTGKIVQVKATLRGLCE